MLPGRSHFFTYKSSYLSTIDHKSVETKSFDGVTSLLSVFSKTQVEVTPYKKNKIKNKKKTTTKKTNKKHKKNRKQRQQKKQETNKKSS